VRLPQQNYYGIGLEWVPLQARTRKAAIAEADRWLESERSQGRYVGYKLGQLLLAKGDADTVTALRYLDESEWVLSGKGEPIQP
jgi:hypothetical protein